MFQDGERNGRHLLFGRVPRVVVTLLRAPQMNLHHTAWDLGKLNLPCACFYNFLDLTRELRISGSLLLVQPRGNDDNNNNHNTWVLKIARFRREIRYIQQELSIYSILESHRFPLSPRLIGLVYEETKDRTIGFLMEEIQGGEYPGIKDIENCSETLRRLHGTGIIHGDVNRYNFLLTEDGAKIFDFETSTTRFDEGVASREIESLWKWLGDDSGMGRE